MTDKSLVELYKEARGQLEFIQQWKGAMFDKIREESVQKAARVYETYMLYDIEACFRGVAKDLVILEKGENVSEGNIKEYIFVPDGLIVVYNNYKDPRDIEVKLTWEDIEQNINKPSGVIDAQI